jgi:hypothetical protein
MIKSNKKILDRLVIKKRLLLIIFITTFLVIFLYLASIYADKAAIEYNNSLKTNMTGTVVSFAQNIKNGGNLCFVKLINHYGVMLRCSGNYSIGQQVNVIKITKPSGEYYYQIQGELFKAYFL